MSLLKRLFNRNKKFQAPLLKDDALTKSVEAVLAPASKLPKKPKGRVIKQTRQAEYNPNPKLGGGRIVKAMPRQLQKIKQRQEKFEKDEEQPQIEQLEE